MADSCDPRRDFGDICCLGRVIVAFRAFHPQRKEVYRYRCWSEITGLKNFRCSNRDNALNWNGGRSIKLEGFDHAPVYIKFRKIPDVAAHHVPALVDRYTGGFWVATKNDVIPSEEILQKPRFLSNCTSLLQKKSAARNSGTQANPYGNGIVSSYVVNHFFIYGLRLSQEFCEGR